MCIRDRALYVCRGEVKSGDTTNREAHAARLYFTALFGRDFSRDDNVPVNAALNYGYAVLLSMVNREVVSRGYLTQCGICHRNEYNQFNFSCDLMEPFRPVVDRLAFDYAQELFDQDVRRLLGDLGNRVVSYKGGSYRLHSVVSLFVQDCLAALNKSLAPSEICLLYTSFWHVELSGSGFVRARAIVARAGLMCELITVSAAFAVPGCEEGIG